MKVKFNEILFDVISVPSISSLRVQANIEKADYTLDKILSEVKASEEMVFYDDNDEITAVYSGYTSPVAVCVMFNDGVEVVSVEMENENIESQIETLTKRINQLEQTRSETKSEEK